MNNNQIEGQVRSAIISMTPNLLDEIMQTPVAHCHSEDTVSTVVGTQLALLPSTRSRTRFIGALASVAAALVLTLSSVALYSATAVTSVIALDVNPSVEISSNKDDRVISAKATNADGEKILGGMNLKNADVDVAMNAIIGSMVNQGYLSTEKNSILVTVSAKDEAKSNELRYHMVSTINEALAQSNIPAHIYNQTVPTVNKAAKSASEQHGISYGKLSFLEKIAAVDPTITIEKLSSMTLDEIDTLLAGYKVKPLDIDLDDDDDDYCEYCGRLETVCRKSCNRSEGKVYCDDCGKLNTQCICVDDDDKQNNRDKDKIDNRPDHANANTENSNRYKDKFDDDDKTKNENKTNNGNKTDNDRDDYDDDDKDDDDKDDDKDDDDDRRDKSNQGNGKEKPAKVKKDN